MIFAPLEGWRHVEFTDRHAAVDYAHILAAWEAHRNKHYAKADWQFTTQDARVKRKRLRPQFQ